MLILTFVLSYSHMSEETKTPQSNQPPHKDLFEESLEMQAAGSARRLEAQRDEAARLTLREEKMALIEEANRKAKRTKVTKDLVAGVALTGVIVGGGVLMGNAINNQAEHVNDQNQKWSNETNQNLQRQDFENGLENGKVTIATPTPTETLLPAPQQIDQKDTQLDGPQLPTK